VHARKVTRPALLPRDARWFAGVDTPDPGGAMSAIEKIVVTCKEQEDWTGSDDLDFYMSDSYIGRLTIQTGETRTVVGPGMLFGDTIWVDEGATLTVVEADLVGDDPILSHTFADSDLDTTITLFDQSPSAKYTFEITSIKF
jgi:hypothetical protein